MNVFSTVNFIKSKYISSIFNENLRVQMRCAVGNRFWAHRTKRTQNFHIHSGSYDYMWKCYLGYLGLNYITKVNFTCFFFHPRVDPWTTQDEQHRSFICLFLNSKYCRVTQSLAGRICRGGTTDTEEAWIWRANHKLHSNFPLLQGLRPLVPHAVQGSAVFFSKQHFSRPSSSLFVCFGEWLAVLSGMWDLSSPTRDQTHSACFGSTVF